MQAAASLPTADVHIVLRLAPAQGLTQHVHGDVKRALSGHNKQKGPSSEDGSEAQPTVEDVDRSSSDLMQ